MEILIVVIINDMVQLYELPLWRSATVISGTVGLMLGGPIGAALTDSLGFRPTFALECLGMIVTLIAIYCTLRLPQKQSEPSESTAKRLEVVSTALLLITVAAPLFALNLGGEIFAWSDPVVVILFCMTPALFALFYLADTYHAVTPIVPKRFIQDRNIAIALACALPMKFSFDQLRFSLGTYLEARSFGHRSIFSDWALTFIYFGRLLGTIIGGILVRRYRKFKFFLQIDIVLDILVYLAFFLGWIHPETPSAAPVLGFIGATEGFAESLWLVAVLSLVSSEDQPLLYAFFGLSLALSGDLGIEISLAAEGTLVRYQLNNKLRGYPNSGEIIRKSLENLDYLRELPDKIQAIILQALISSTEVAFG
ncbi:hypothetical protein QBC44DRAFT_368739 [Cladorrhinum sp. PSN332]|nr:hypothetical protein QBC44DRAFT_368739 [Cladorrhinum sp. PSN332]